MGSLTEPLPLRGHQAPSRVLFGPHATNLAAGRALGDRHVAYYRARARGGCGVLVTETASVTDDDWPHARAPLAAACEAGWTAVAGVVQASGAIALAGLGHTGSQGSSAHSQSVLWAPSPVADPISREMPAAMGQEQIAGVVGGFAHAAAIAVRAGMDGVEVDAGARSLLRQFASPLTNHRTDAHGLDRLLLLREVLAAVRTAAGAGPLLALRLCCDELAPWAGIMAEQALGHVAVLAPLVDLLVVVRGGPFAPMADRPGAHEAPGFSRDLCAAVREAAGPTPVVWQGSVVDAGEAQAALDAGVCDLVEMTRAQIADPQLVEKVRAGRAERVRPCILCNQACQVGSVSGDVDVPVSCVVEPRSGHEGLDETDELETDAPEGEVLVVGGGPAGLEAARVLAGAGRRVRLVERAPRLGGALADAALGPGRQRFRRFTQWQASECVRLGVAVSLNTTATAHDLDATWAAGGDVVLATGSLPRQRTTPALDVLDVLRSGASSLPPGPVVLDDPVGGPVAVAAAQWLAAAGRSVSIVTPDAVVGRQLASTGDLSAANTRLARAGVGREVRSAVAWIGEGEVVLEDVWTGAQRVVRAAAVIDCGHRMPEDRLARERPEALCAGDAVAPRTVAEAVIDGRRAAAAVRRRRHGRQHALAAH